VKGDLMVIDSFVDCIPCVLTMADKLADKYLKTKKEKFDFMIEVLEMISTIEYSKTAPYLTARVMRMLKEQTGIQDLFEEEKKKFNSEVLKFLPEFTEYVDNSEDKIKTALKLSIAGNIIDSAIVDDISIDLVKKVIDKTIEDDFDEELFKKFINDLESKEELLYLGDNTGEVVFDKLFIMTIKKMYPNLKIIFVTRGDYILNDITKEDAFNLEIDKYAEIIDNGADLPGTDLSEVSESFLETFNKSSFIISKGQGNFESLPGTGKNIYYLFLCKCELLQKQLGREKLESVFMNESDLVKLKGANNEGINFIS
jgi:uncharacterized protein with ATP-grasp and redox domains